MQTADYVPSLANPPRVTSNMNKFNLTPLATDGFEGYAHVPLTSFTEQFRPNETLEKARKTYFVFLVISLLLSSGAVSISTASSASLSVIGAHISSPRAIEAGLWLLFGYTYLVYIQLVSKEIETYYVTRKKIHRGYDMQVATDLLLWQAGKRGATTLDRNNLSLMLASPSHQSSGVYVYEVSERNVNPRDRPMLDTLWQDNGSGLKMVSYKPFKEADDYFNTVEPVLVPTLRYNSLVYLVPLWLGAAVSLVPLYKLTRLFAAYHGYYWQDLYLTFIDLLS